MTDIVTFLLSFFFLIHGAMRGFLRSLLVPLSIIIATIISIIYYQFSNDVVVSLLIALIGPLFLNLLLRVILKTWAMATNTDIKPDLLSRFGGAILTFAWGWVFIVFTLVLLAVLPPWGNTLKAVHNDVTKSASYFFAKPLGEFLFASSKLGVPAVKDGNTSLADTKSLADDPRFLKVLQDPDIQKEIEAHNLVDLMSNPKMIELTRQIMSDPATLKKVMAIYSSQMQPQSTKNP